MWPGPYGDLGSRKYLTASLDQSLTRMGLDYVDVFYHHRFDPRPRWKRRWARSTTPCARARRSTSASPRTRPSAPARPRRSCAASARRCLIHQPSYSMLNRWVEDGLLDVLDELGVGCIAFSPLAQGLLTDRYLNGVPEGSRASRGTSLASSMLSEENLAHVRALNDIAAARGQTLAQMALAWVLRDPRVTSALVGASSVAQLEENLDALDAPRLQRRGARAHRRARRRGRHRPLARGREQLGRRPQHVRDQVARPFRGACGPGRS